MVHMHCFWKSETWIFCMLHSYQENHIYYDQWKCLLLWHFNTACWKKNGAYWILAIQSNTSCWSQYLNEMNIKYLSHMYDISFYNFWWEKNQTIGSEFYYYFFFKCFKNLRMDKDLVKKLGVVKLSMVLFNVSMLEWREEKILLEWCISFLPWFLHQVAPNQEWYLPLTSSIPMLLTPKSKPPKASWERPKNLRQSPIGKKKNKTKIRMMINVSLLHANDAFTWKWSAL